MPDNNPAPVRTDTWRLLRPALIVAVVLVASASLLVGYPIVRIRVARSRVATYCDGVPVGQPVTLTAMAEDATRRGFSVVGPMADPVLGGEPAPAAPEHAPRQKLMVIDGWVFARWFCDISAEDGVITKKRVSFLD